MPYARLFCGVRILETEKKRRFTMTAVAEMARVTEVAASSKETWRMAYDQPILGYIVLGLAALVLALIAGTIVFMLLKGTAGEKIIGLVFEVRVDGQPGKPSVSRLQMLIWNFVVAFGFLYVLGTKMNLSEAIGAILQPEVLALLGISNATYLLGKRTKQGSALPAEGNPQKP
jgi:hypothetical protein